MTTFLMYIKFYFVRCNFLNIKLLMTLILVYYKVFSIIFVYCITLVNDKVIKRSANLSVVVCKLKKITCYLYVTILFYQFLKLNLNSLYNDNMYYTVIFSY